MWPPRTGREQQGLRVFRHIFLKVVPQVVADVWRHDDGAAVEDRRILRNPCDGVKLPKRQHADRGYLSHAQVAALADAVERQASNAADLNAIDRLDELVDQLPVAFGE
jgi:hypothetical protein